MNFVHDFSQLEKRLNLKFKNKDLLIQAFCHRSYLNENPKFHLEHNERLEFLGDAVLELIITGHLYQNYPKKSEGDLTNWRAALVNSKMLARVAQEIDLNGFLLLSRGEVKEMGKARQCILANTFEALIGALYLDQGYDVCQKFITKHLTGKLPHIIEAGLYKDSKSLFQEEAQERTGITPIYQVLKERGPDHTKHFIVGVLLNKELVAEGEGFSKQEAEEAAAKKALEVKKW
ncbi:MAG TPA: ribonuclease III [Candidatus Nealsonbacteria bacterium]|uniref:ribonuclease III n=1 Tax=marine sediment metagenome TaxID=412755 RepID=A0A0F9U7N1_9ZZZZ|nr:ribonuclease III [Candidatus Nealsonbacteria bacterium]HEB46605.1 ribonuclease III [Candidatus Nealsonbacteria bacterium]